jgi:uncharacterized HAD superfamily protein
LSEKRLRIALDLDGVLADTIQTCCAILNARRTTPQITPEDFNKWNAWENASITKREFWQLLDEAWVNWRKIPPVEENLTEEVSQLARQGRIDIVTGRSEPTIHFAKEWLRSHRIPYDHFVRTSSVLDKVRLEYDIYIDDSDDLMALIASRLVGFGFLYEQPWNRQAKDMPRIYKIKSWNSISPLVSALYDNGQL